MRQHEKYYGYTYGYGSDERLDRLLKEGVNRLARWLLKVIFIYIPIALVAAFLLFCILLYFFG